MFNQYRPAMQRGVNSPVNFARSRPAFSVSLNAEKSCLVLKIVIGDNLTFLLASHGDHGKKAGLSLAQLRSPRVVFLG
jgi:hypothetical protein